MHYFIALVLAAAAVYHLNGEALFNLYAEADFRTLGTVLVKFFGLFAVVDWLLTKFSRLLLGPGENSFVTVAAPYLAAASVAGLHFWVSNLQTAHWMYTADTAMNGEKSAYAVTRAPTSNAYLGVGCVEKQLMAYTTKPNEAERSLRVTYRVDGGPPKSRMWEPHGAYVVLVDSDARPIIRDLISAQREIRVQIDNQPEFAFSSDRVKLTIGRILEDCGITI